MGFATKLKAARESVGLTQQQVSDIMGIDKSTYCGYETEKRQPDVQKIKQLSKILNIASDDLLETGHSTTKKSPSVSDETDDIAVLYRRLDERGKGAVRAILQYEAEPTKTNVIAHPKTAKAKKNSDGFIEFHVYDQPAAAGLGNYLDEPDYHIEQYPAEVVPSKADFGIVISGDSMEPKIHDGCTAFVQSALSIEDGQIGIFRLNGSAYCKKLSIDRKKRQVKLVSLNKKYGDILIGEYDKFDTVGLVTGTYSR